MKKRIPSLLAAACAVTLITISSASAATFVSDQFIDGGKTNGADAQDIAWFSVGSGASSSVASDNTTGPNEGVVDNFLLSTAGGQAARGVVGLLPSAFTLAATGDNITVEFDVRFQSNPADATGGFRFGVANSAGTAVTTDPDTAASVNDTGYFGRISTRATTAGVVTINVGRETGGNGLPTSGTDTTLLGGTQSGSATDIIGSTTFYRLSLSVTRNAGSGLDFIVSKGNGTQMLTPIFTATDASPVTFTFDEITAFNFGGVQNFGIDNVLVTTTVPEPSTYASILCGLGLLIGSRRFMRKRSA